MDTLTPVGVEYVIRYRADGRTEDYLTDRAWVHADDESGRPWTLTLQGPHAPALRDADVILWDTHVNVTPLYRAGHNPRTGQSYWMPMPLSRGHRADNGREIDMRTWKLAPGRFVHVKVGPRS
jgi:hypothetical protein